MNNIFLKKTILLVAAVTATITLTSCDCNCTKTGETKLTTHESSHFYQNDKIDMAATKAAYYDLMNSFNYPIVPRLQSDEFWAADFKQEDMSKLGMAGVFWINEKGVYGETGAKKYSGKFKGQQFGYLGHEIFLLPNQAIPEHTHIGGPEGFGPKAEAWQVRYGKVRFFGEIKIEGAKLISELPKKDLPWGFGESWFKSKYYVEGQPGDVVKLADPESWHFQQAGPEGAIVTEFGTYHNHVVFSKPGLVWGNTGDK